MRYSLAESRPCSESVLTLDLQQKLVSSKIAIKRHKFVATGVRSVGRRTNELLCCCCRFLLLSSSSLCVDVIVVVLSLTSCVVVAVDVCRRHHCVLTSTLCCCCCCRRCVLMLSLSLSNFVASVLFDMYSTFCCV